MTYRCIDRLSVILAFSLANTMLFARVAYFATFMRILNPLQVIDGHSEAMAGSRASSDSGTTSLLLSGNSAARFTDLLAETMQAMSISSRSHSRAPSSSGGSSTYELFSPTIGGGGSSSAGQTMPLFGTGSSVRHSSRRSSFGSSSSTIFSGAPSSHDEASLLVSDFFSESGKFVSDASTTASMVRDRKLLLWQAFLVDFGVCASASNGGMAVPATATINRPAHFPAALLPLPTSLNQSKKLIKDYLFVNLRDYQESVKRGGEEIEIFGRCARI